jgi:hypothetical protein
MREGVIFNNENKTAGNAILATGITEDHAITPGQMNPFANIIGSRPRLSTDTDLIAREGTRPAFKQDWVPSCQHGREPPLECGISIQDFRPRSVRTENGAPRLDRARHHVLLKRCQECRRGLLESRHQCFAANLVCALGLYISAGCPSLNRISGHCLDIGARLGWH